MAEKILFEYRAHEPGDSSSFKFRSCARPWNACDAVFMSCFDLHAASTMASHGMKHGSLDDTLAFFESMYKDIFGGDEIE